MMKTIKLKGFPEASRSWIVCWSIGTSTELSDHWEVRESYEEAKDLFDSLYEVPFVYVSSLCAVMDSSDYEPHPAFSEPKQMTEAEYQAAINT